VGLESEYRYRKGSTRERGVPSGSTGSGTGGGGETMAPLTLSDISIITGHSNDSRFLKNRILVF
jgi:hypothetical protein